MIMIKERYCSFEVSELLREKGFDEPCRAVYEEKILRINTLCDYFNSELSSHICAPTPQMARDWLRKKGILLWVYPAICLKVDDNRTFHWMWDGKKQRHDAQHFGDKHSYDSYEKAEEAAIKYGLTKLI